MAPGSMQAPLARRLKDRSGEVALTMEGGRSSVVLADNPPIYRDRRLHNLALAVDKNIPKKRVKTFSYVRVFIVSIIFDLNRNKSLIVQSMVITQWALT